MPRSKTNKPSSSTSKPGERRPRGERSGSAAPAPAPGGLRRFSLWQFPFAVPTALHALLRLASVVVLLLVPALAARAEMGSLWKADSSRSMFADKRARSVGDILTILVQESTSASKDNSTKTSKKSSVNASIDAFLYSPAASGLLTKAGQMPAMRFGGAQDFDGGGKINNSERITGRVAVRVVD